MATAPSVHRRSTFRSIIARWWPYALILGLYTVTSPYHRGLNNPNEMVRVYMTKAWVETGRFAIGSVVREWGPVDDKAIRSGELYSSKAPLQSLVGIPAYAVAPHVLELLESPVNKRTLTWVVRLFGASIFGIGFSWTLLAWCRRRSIELGADPAYGTTIGLGLALGTMIYPYSITFTGHGLAALTAGGCYLAVVAISRSAPGSAPWIRAAIIAGALGGAAPFAEYPAALVAAPALVAAFVITPTWSGRGRLFGWLAVGGAAPFGLGLWVHHALWGHPLRTGYGFLENRAYVEVHGEGFFGVSFPKLDALIGSLFSAGTGLFFFSPLLIAGAVAVVFALAAPKRFFGADPRAEPAPPIARSLAVAAAVGVMASLYFISAHRGWRGGWTVGPRYIVAVAPLLGIWTIESLRLPRTRPLVAGLTGLAIVTSGFPAALYPHLSDVFTNPLRSFVWPSYASGHMTYGLGHTLGLQGWAANAVHAVPLVGAILFCLATGMRSYAASQPSARSRRGPKRPRLVAVTMTLAPLAVGVLLVSTIPERDPAAAQAETWRLWGFWEPVGPDDGPKPPARRSRPGRVFHGRRAYRQMIVNVISDSGRRRCAPFQGRFCAYGDQPWQRFGPERLTMAGNAEDVLFLHPIAGRQVRVTWSVPDDAKTMVLYYGMADASIGAANPHPIRLTLHQGEAKLADLQVELAHGLRSLEVRLADTQRIHLTTEVVEDGARVFGFDVELFR